MREKSPFLIVEEGSNFKGGGVAVSWRVEVRGEEEVRGEKEVRGSAPDPARGRF